MRTERFSWVTLRRELVCVGGRRAFTLVELLVVIGIIAMLISILLPALNKAKQQALLVQCCSNLRQLAMASINYAVDNQGYFPAGYSEFAAAPGLPPDQQEWPARLQGYVRDTSGVFSCPVDFYGSQNFELGEGTGQIKTYTANGLNWLFWNNVPEGEPGNGYPLVGPTNQVVGTIGPTRMSNVKHPTQCVLLTEIGLGREQWLLQNVSAYGASYDPMMYYDGTPGNAISQGRHFLQTKTFPGYRGSTTATFGIENFVMCDGHTESVSMQTLVSLKSTNYYFYYPINSLADGTSTFVQLPHPPGASAQFWFVPWW